MCIGLQRLSADLESIARHDSGGIRKHGSDRRWNRGPPFIARWVRNENTTNPDTLEAPQAEKNFRTKRSDAWPWPSAWPARRAGRFTENANKRRTSFWDRQRSARVPPFPPARTGQSGNRMAPGVSRLQLQAGWERIGAQPCHKAITEQYRPIRWHFH